MDGVTKAALLLLFLQADADTSCWPQSIPSPCSEPGSHHLGLSAPMIIGVRPPFLHESPMAGGLPPPTVWLLFPQRSRPPRRRLGRGICRATRRFRQGPAGRVAGRQRAGSNASGSGSPRNPTAGCRHIVQSAPTGARAGWRRSLRRQTHDQELSGTGLIPSEAMVCCRPSARPMVGSHPRSRCARPMSGWRTIGSSCGSAS